MSRRFTPKIKKTGDEENPQKKIKFNFIDESEESSGKGPKKFIKSVLATTKVSELPCNCLKTDKKAIEFEIYINDQLIGIDDLNKEIQEFDQPILVIFKGKPESIPLFHTIKYPKGNCVEFDTKKYKDTLETIGIDLDTDMFYIFDSNGNEVSDIKYESAFKLGGEFYCINYPKNLFDSKPPQLFKQLQSNLNIEQTEFRQLLCILYKMKNQLISENIKKQLSKETKYNPINKLCEPFLNIIHKETQKDIKKYFLQFIFSLKFIKGEEESYPELVSRLYKSTNEADKPFDVIDSSIFITQKNVPVDTIIKMGDVYGIYKGSNKSKLIKYYDPFSQKENKVSIDLSDIKEPNQITAIFVDTSGSMRAAFLNQRRYEAASEIANKLIECIHEFNLYDSLIVTTSFAEKLDYTRIPLSIEKKEVEGKTNIWVKLEYLLEVIKKKKEGNKDCPVHIVIITDGENTEKPEKREDILKEIKKEKIIVDSIILCDDEHSQDPSIFAEYTNGVYMFAPKLSRAIKFVTSEPFFNLSIRKTLIEKDVPESPFGSPEKKMKISHRTEHFAQLEPYEYDPHFYVNLNNGLYKPDPDNFNDIKNIKAEELFECLKEENESSLFYTFLVQTENDDDHAEKEEDHPDDGDDGSDSERNDDDDDDDDDDEDKHKTHEKGKKDEKRKICKKEQEKLIKMLDHWCVFAKFGKKEDAYFWQIKVDFDSRYPNTLPIMRIISHPEIIKYDEQIISKYGTIHLNNLLNNTDEHLSIFKILKKLIKAVKDKFEYEEFKSRYINSPVSVINQSLARIIKVKFEKGCGIKEDEGEKFEQDDDDDDNDDDEKKDKKVKEDDDDNDDKKKDKKVKEDDDDNDDEKKDKKVKEDKGKGKNKSQLKREVEGKSEDDRNAKLKKKSSRPSIGKDKKEDGSDGSSEGTRSKFNESEGESPTKKNKKGK